jgi:TolA-binding protein
VAALAESRWTQSREGGIERVTLESGWVRIHVRPQRPAERFLVALPDGELEVRGTTFEVTVEGSATRDVHVDDGVVELRLADDPPRRLGAGDMWRASPRAPVAVAAVSAPHPGPERVGSAEYMAAMQLLLQGRNAEASTAFEAFVLAHPGASQVEDATYLDVVALSRAGRTDAAALAAEQHLRRFPGSFHRKEVALVIALAASLRGDCPRARAVVAEWTRGAPDADVRAALRACEGK